MDIIQQCSNNMYKSLDNNLVAYVYLQIDFRSIEKNFFEYYEGGGMLSKIRNW